MARLFGELKNRFAKTTCHHSRLACSSVSSVTSRKILGLDGCAGPALESSWQADKPFWHTLADLAGDLDDQVLNMALPATVLASLTWNHGVATLGHPWGAAHQHCPHHGLHYRSHPRTPARGRGNRRSGPHVRCASGRKSGHAPHGESRPTNRGHPGPKRCTTGTR
jgi:hypothetical protein